MGSGVVERRWKCYSPGTAAGVRERILESGEEWIYEDDYWDPLWDPDEERRPWTTTETTRWDDSVQGNNHAESEI